jgi:hypothetical protein
MLYATSSKIIAQPATVHVVEATLVLSWAENTKVGPAACQVPYDGGMQKNEVKVPRFCVL